MEAIEVPRAPSTCSTSPVADDCEDIVSLPSTDDDREVTYTPGHDSRTTVTLGKDSQENCVYRDGPKCHRGSTEQQSDLQNEKAPVEKPKVIWTRSRKRALRHFLLLHFVPVAITLVLFWLYLDGFQWRANDIQLKALLFAAKLHESLILISLGDILFHRIRYHLLTGRGISFGLLVSPFRVSNPLSLFQAPFLASARLTLKSGPELVTVLLVVIVSALALLAAPSSGALMLPRYDWWQASNDDFAMTKFKEQDLEAATYIGARFEDLFPLLVDGRFGPDKIRDVSLDIFSLSDRLGQIVSGLGGVLVDRSLQGNANITVVDDSTVDSFALAYQEDTLDDCDRSKYPAEIQDYVCQSVAVQATSPLALVTQKLFNRYRAWTSSSSSMSMITAQALDSKSGDLTWRQPSVSMQCSTVAYENGTMAYPELHTLPTVSLPRWGSFSPLHLHTDSKLREEIRQMGSIEGPVATYTDITRLLPAGVTASTALLMNVGRDTLVTTTYLCLVDARWIESRVWFTPPFATIMRSGVSLESVQTITGSNTTTTTNPVIEITPEYANSLSNNLSVISSYSSSSLIKNEESPFNFIDPSCNNRVTDTLHAKCSILAHALYLTDSLRRTQSLFRYHTAKELQESKNPSMLKSDEWTKLDYRLYHQLHAYVFEGSLIKLSMSVLLVHMMLVYAHLLLLVLGDGWCSRAWTELGELVALAIQTQPSPLLQNAGGGVRNWQTWKLRTFVREVTPEGRLELVLKETDGSPRVLVELDEGQEKPLVEPEADRRYG